MLEKEIELLKQVLKLGKKIKELEPTSSYPHWSYYDISTTNTWTSDQDLLYIQY